MKKIVSLSFALIFLFSCNNKHLLYKSKDFVIGSDFVQQGDYTAKAISNKELKSNYQVLSKKGESAHKEWFQSRDLSSFPQFKSDFELLNVLYNLSLEEAENLITSDSVFDTGAKWGGVWTRDLSYASMLSLSTTHPQIVKNGLMKKVKDKRIVQDTGTGGAWPVSTDRMIWAAAAFHLYKVTGDQDWLRYIYVVIKNSLDDDLKIALTPQYGVKGESSFIDWREQSYPRWMQPVDIYNSENLGTMAAEYKAFIVLAQISELLSKDGQKYLDVANKIREKLNSEFWNNSTKSFTSYVYGRNNLSAVDKTEALGVSNVIRWGICDDEIAKEAIANFPVVEWGTPVFYPQIPNMHPYHNNGIWPFVQAYWNLAAKKVKNAAAVDFGMAGLWRSGGLFVTNYENYVAQTGDWEQTDVEAMNSHNMLWSIAGMLSNYYDIIFGLEYNVNSLHFNPFIPNEQYSGIYELKNFKYRNTKLNIVINGYGDKIASFKIDGVESDPYIESTLEGEHNIDIVMNNFISDQSQINLVENKFSPETPIVKLVDGKLKWEASQGAVTYLVYKNGVEISKTNSTEFAIEQGKAFDSYQVKAVSKDNLYSFLSEPIELFKEEIQVELSSIKNKSSDSTDYLELTQIENNNLEFLVDIPSDDNYTFMAVYANGNGPINTENKCAIRSLYIDDNYTSPLVLPQRGENNWSEYGNSNYIKVMLKKGQHRFNIKYDSFNQNMNGEINNARLKKILIRKN